MKILKLLCAFLAIVAIGCQNDSSQLSESERLTITLLKSQEFASLGIAEHDLNLSSMQIALSQNGAKSIVFSTKTPSAKTVGAFFLQNGKVGMAYVSEYVSDDVSVRQASTLTMEEASAALENGKFNGSLVMKAVHANGIDEFTIPIRNSLPLKAAYAKVGKKAPDVLYDCYADSFYKIGSKNLLGKVATFLSLGATIAWDTAECVWGNVAGD
jgi:hypothetical protein